VTPLEIEYSPSSCIASIDEELARYRDLSEAARSRHTHEVVFYGDHADEFSIVFTAQPGPAPLLVFIHGGYWQQLSAWHSLVAAPELVAAGVSYAAVNYSLAPQATIEKMIEQCCVAVDMLWRTLAPSTLTLSGSSAGAHLAARTAQRIPGCVHELILMSGVFDLRPLVDTYINDALQLDHVRATALSVDHGHRPVDRVRVFHGQIETDAFKRQSAQLAAAWAVPVAEVAGRNHFDLVSDLAAIHLGASSAEAAVE
jgi:arylformamidase